LFNTYYHNYHSNTGYGAIYYHALLVSMEDSIAKATRTGREFVADESSTNCSLEALVDSNEWHAVYQLMQANPEAAQTPRQNGWMTLHWLASIGSAPVELIELVASQYPQAISLPDVRFLDTPLHIIARNSQTSAQKLRCILRYTLNDSNSESIICARNRSGGTALHSAANHNAVLDALKALVDRSPALLSVTTLDGTYAVSALWNSYVNTIPGTTSIARILAGQVDAMCEPFFQRFWSKAEFIALGYFQSINTWLTDQDIHKYLLHALLKSNVEINFFKVALKRQSGHEWCLTADSLGNLPLHRLVQDRPYRLKEKDAIEAALLLAPEAANTPNLAGDYPLTIAIRNKIPIQNGLLAIVQRGPVAVESRDRSTQLYPFQLAAVQGGRVAIDTTFTLLATRPDLLTVKKETALVGL
jgi:ankyrin repeat protein